MLVDSRVLLDQARDGGYAVGAFNTYNLEMSRGILEAAERMGSPIILQVGASALQDAGVAPLSALVVAAAEAAQIPVAVHLDHARDLGVLSSCIELGFTSAMFDGSDLPYGQNIDRTREAVALVHAAGLPLEGELGWIAGDEDNDDRSQRRMPYTDPKQAASYVQETAVDMLAVAIGNRHGFYEGNPRLDLTRLASIAEHVEVPLVLHGASGIPKDLIQEAIKLGIRKINVNTELRHAFIDALKISLANPHLTYNLPHLMANAITAVAEVVADFIALFRSPGHA